MQTDDKRAGRPLGIRQWVGGLTPPRTSRHRDVKSGGARAAVLGAGDGLLTNLSLILGVAGASVPASTVRLAGVAGLLAGAFSMAAGELVSVRAQKELAEEELQVERDELSDSPEAELMELAAMYRSQGDVAERCRRRGPHAVVQRERGARHPRQPGARYRPRRARGSRSGPTAFSFVSFTVGAVLPLIPWFFISGTAAVLASLLIGAVASLALGACIGVLAGRSPWKTALRQLAGRGHCGGHHLRCRPPFGVANK